MFTGLIEEIGKVKSISKNSQGMRVEIGCNNILKNSKIGDSIATEGVCLTVTKLGKDSFFADVMNETLKITTLRELKIGDLVNLEKSLTLKDYLGGHLVMGDIDCCGIIIDIIDDGFSRRYMFEIPEKFLKYIVYKGRISIAGASLTVASITEKGFTVSLIPHTQNNITLGYKRIGDKVNIETDLIAKHLEKLLNFKEKKEKKVIDNNFLAENGFF